MSRYARVMTMQLLLLLSSVHPLLADRYNDLSTQFAFAANNTWEQEIKPKFMRVLSAAERTVVNTTDFRFPPGGGSYDAFAMTNGGQRIIVISGAFVAFQDSALDAFLMSNHFGMEEQYLPYLDYANDLGIDNVARWKAHEPLQLIPSFAMYAHLQPQEVADFARSQAYQGPLLSLRIESLAYVLGHEIGHQVHNDHGPTTDEEQREREIAADQYSLRLILRAGFSPWSAIPVMMFFHEAGGDDRHPPPMCRAAAFYLRGLPTLLQDRRFQEFSDQHPDERAKVDAVRSFLADHESEIRADCGDWVYAAD